jgi:DnaK suppressor protein
MRGAPRRVLLSPRKRRLNAKRVREFQKRLSAERDEVLASIAEIEARTSGQDEFETVADERNSDDGPSDAAIETLDRGTEFALEENLRTMLEEIDAAIEKIGKGTYGVCDNCGRDIKMARLERIPSATMCVECQERLERR